MASFTGQSVSEFFTLRLYTMQKNLEGEHIDPKSGKHFAGDREYLKNG
jgi:hypothetical protein